MRTIDFNFPIDIETESGEPEYFVEVRVTANYDYSSPMFEDRIGRTVADPGDLIADLGIEVFDGETRLDKYIKLLNLDKWKEIEEEAESEFMKRLEND